MNIDGLRIGLCVILGLALAGCGGSSGGEAPGGDEALPAGTPTPAPTPVRFAAIDLSGADQPPDIATAESIARYMASSRATAMTLLQFADLILNHVVNAQNQDGMSCEDVDNDFQQCACPLGGSLLVEDQADFKGQDVFNLLFFDNCRYADLQVDGTARFRCFNFQFGPNCSNGFVSMGDTSVPEPLDIRRDGGNLRRVISEGTLGLFASFQSDSANIQGNLQAHFDFASGNVLDVDTTNLEIALSPGDTHAHRIVYSGRTRIGASANAFNCANGSATTHINPDEALLTDDFGRGPIAAGRMEINQSFEEPRRFADFSAGDVRISDSEDNEIGALDTATETGLCRIF